ncbi:Endochitinase B [Penicillium herquei]|nr:Endochitinase B [Penicillium herquei]
MFTAATNFFRRRPVTVADPAICGSPGTYEVPLYTNAAYYPNWRIYRKQPPSSLRLGFISHVFYSFACDEWADTQMPVDGAEGCLRAFVQLKQQYSQMRVILSVGGGGKGSENFAAVAHDPTRLETFVRTARELVDQYGLDGIDIDWEHPADSTQGKDYVRLLARIREVLPSPYVLASCLPAGEWALQNIDLSAAHKYLDMINLMTYDFSGPWEPETGHQAQLYGTPTSCYLAVSYILSQGVPSRKVILGIPTYGRSFLDCNGPGQKYTELGGEDGVFDYRDLPRPEAQEILDNQAGAAYCVGGDGGFVTYDIPATVQQKAQLVTTTKLGGLFYWHICSDSRGPRSLIETGYNTLHDM